jgi:CheY-like chemotaxis protein
MLLTTAVLVDDRPETLGILARVLERAGWQTHAALGSLEGEALAARILAGPDAAQTVILTDLHMPGDRYAAQSPWAAGAYLALRLRARMAWGALPRAPIVAITSLLAPELRYAALVAGCDAVLEKNPPLQLAARVTAVLEQSYHPESPSGFDEMLRLARSTPSEAPSSLPITIADVTAALLAYRRSGVVGLGASALARALAPQAGSVVQRGEAAYAQIRGGLAALAALGAGEAAAILRTELEREAAPDERALERAFSRAQYYRHRRHAVRQLRDLLAHEQATPVTDS